jgi:peptidoglycan/xylan/chitin deacetylase (PgdA/CDA1 family)
MNRWFAFIAVGLLFSCATPQQPGGPEVALTIDDLPVHGPIPSGETPQSVASGVIDALTGAHVPAYGFVNAHWTAEQPETLDVLRAWRAAGLALGNHGWAHRHLSELTAAEFERELVRNEPVLQPLGGDWHWFRYPFLDEGENAAKRTAAREVLALRGYRVAAVTMDFGDWQWTAPYARCRVAGNAAAIVQLEQMYLQAAREGIAYSRGMSRKLYGRDIPFVLLLHDSAFEARMLSRLIQLYRSEGFRFVSLPDAERDPAYADQLRPDSAAEPKGLEGKAIARGIALLDRTDFAPALAAICPESLASRRRNGQSRALEVDRVRT